MQTERTKMEGGQHAWGDGDDNLKDKKTKGKGRGKSKDPKKNGKDNGSGGSRNIPKAKAQPGQ